jgi:hypothetical protein
MKNLYTVLYSIVLIPGIILANIINVPADQSTIQDGINAAVAGDTVLVADGLYFENIDFKGKAITVASHFLIDGNPTHIDSTIIDGSQPSNPDSGSVVCFSSGGDTTSVLCGFTITGGSGSYWATGNVYGGGGICMYTGGKIIHNKITGNQVHVVTQHGAGGGGLVFVALNNTSLIIEYNEFTHNSLSSPVMPSGGGFWLGPRWNDGYIRVNNNLISNNSVTCTETYKAMGGGLSLSLLLPTAGNILVENNKIANNELHCIASIGGGIYVVYDAQGSIITDEYPCPIISNNIISNNYSEGLGGGIGVWTIEYSSNWPSPGSIIEPQPVLVNNTIANNVAQDGCGLFNFDSYPLLLNNILWDDLSASGSNEIFDSNINFSPYVPPYHDPINDGTVDVFYSDLQGGWEGDGNTNAEPWFVDAANDDFNLMENSPGIGWGTDSLIVPKLDFYGNMRPHSVDDYVDMGAIESTFEKTPPPPTAIDDMSNAIPFEFALNQNHPNPFNPTTIINYELPITNYIELTVYNTLGQKVATLVNKRQQAGLHQVEWNASEFSSGVYYYKIEAGKLTETRKMVYLK